MVVMYVVSDYRAIVGLGWWPQESPNVSLVTVICCHGKVKLHAASCPGRLS